MVRSLQWRIYYQNLCGQLSTTCGNKVAQWAAHSCCPLPPATKNMTSKTVDLIDWPLPPTVQVPPEHHLYGANASYKPRLKQARREPCNFRILGHFVTYAATQVMPWVFKSRLCDGIKRLSFIPWPLVFSVINQSSTCLGYFKSSYGTLDLSHICHYFAFISIIFQ